jgi:hypothetical protein
MSTASPPPSPSPHAAPQPELLVSSALHLMTHYSAQAGKDRACTSLASVIERHLKALAGHHDLSPVLRATCQQLAEQWAVVVDQHLPKPTPRTLLGCFAHGPRGT